MYGLILDTSSKPFLLALSLSGKLLEQRYFHSDMQPSSKIFLEIQELLKKYAFSFKDLSYFAVGTGPGTFVGTRCGAMIAKCIGYGAGVPLLSFSSLSLFYPEEEGAYLALSDAKGGYFYCQEGVRRENSLELKPAQLIEASLFDNYQTGKGHFISPLDFPSLPKVAAKLPDSTLLLPSFEARAQAGESVSPMELLPLYLRFP